jgi:hypothetical protein
VLIVTDRLSLVGLDEVTSGPAALHPAPGMMAGVPPPPPPPLPPPHPVIKKTLRMNITTRQLFRVLNLSIITPPLHFSIVVAEILQRIPPVKNFVFLELVKMI